MNSPSQQIRRALSRGIVPAVRLPVQIQTFSKSDLCGYSDLCDIALKMVCSASESRWE